MAMADADWGGHSGSRLGLDIGGTLAKLVFFESEMRPSWCNGKFAKVIKNLGMESVRSEDERDFFQDFVFRRQGSFWGARDKELAFYDEELMGVFHFLCFQSEKMERFVSLLGEQDLHHDIDEIYTTGGGAYKYAALFSEKLGITLKPVDELGVVVKGISWLLRRPLPDEVCWLSEEAPKKPSFESECRFLRKDVDIFPFILVNIGSGVSIVKVDGIDKFERISGSALGGGTFWGLCNLLCPECKEFSDASHLAVEGDASKLNLLVEDIYGGDYELTGGKKLPGNLVASFFAKAGRTDRSAHDDAAVLNALITMISQNICQIAFLNSRLHSISRIVFTGNFLRQNQVARQAIATNMRRVSATGLGKQIQALFLQHEGYFGALGSFLHNVEGEHTSSKVPTCQRLPTLLEKFSGSPHALWTKGRQGNLMQKTHQAMQRCLQCFTSRNPTESQMDGEEELESVPFPKELGRRPVSSEASKI